MKRQILLVFALVLVAPAAAHAASDLAEFAWKVGNTALLLGVLYYVGRKPVRNYLAERRDTVRNQIETSEKLLKDAEGRLAEWTRRAESLDAEVAAIRESARKAAEQEAAAIVADAEATARRIRENAAGAAESELRRARESLRREAAELAVGMAERLLREQVTDADRDRLVDEFVERVRAEGGR